MTVAQWTPRRPAGRALDLGTGCGVQALHLAGHAATVVVDRPLRARARLRPVQRGARRGAGWDVRAGIDPRPGRERTVRPRREQPAVRHHAATPGCRAPTSTATPAWSATPSSESWCARWATTSNPAASPCSSATGRPATGRPGATSGRSWLDGTGLDAWVVQRDDAGPGRVRRALGAGRRRQERDGRVRGPVCRVARRLRRPGGGAHRLRGGRSAAPAPDRDRPGSTSSTTVARWPTRWGRPCDAGLRARTWLAEHDDDALLDVAWSCAPDVHRGAARAARRGRPVGHPATAGRRTGPDRPARHRGRRTGGGL